MAEEEKKAAVERKPRGRKPKTAETVESPAAEESTVKRTTRGRKSKVAAQELTQKSVDTQATDAGVDAAVTASAEERTTKRMTRGRKPKVVAQESVDTQATEAGVDAADAVAAEERAVKRTTRGRKPKMAAEEPVQKSVDTQAMGAGADAADAVAAEESAPKRLTRVRKSQTEGRGEAAMTEGAEMTMPKSAEVSEAASKAATSASTETLTDDTSGRDAEPGSLTAQAERIRARRVKEMVDRSDAEAAGRDVKRTAHDGETARTEVVEKTDELDNETQKAPSGNPCGGILEVMPDGFGFTRSDNFMPGDSDVYVNPAIIKRYRLKTGDVIHGLSRAKNPNERYAALSYIETVNGKPLSEMFRRRSFESLTPIFPNQRIRLEVPGERSSTSLRILDLLAPIGKGQRGMIVSPPKAGKTTLLKQVAKAIVKNEPKMHLLILLIDERPEEVTDMKEEVEGGLVTVIYSTFDEVPEHHKRVAEMTIERAKRLVEQGEDVTILLDSITRLARAYNLVVPASGRTLSGGLDPAALHMPKRFFGAARNMREGGSLTILSTALVETGSRMDDVIYEEFKGTGNMELVLNRELQERRIFPAIDIVKSGTRRDDLLLSELEQRAVDIIHKRVSDEKASSAEEVIQLFERTSSNEEVCEFVVNGKAIPSGSARMNSGIRSNPGTKTNGNLDSGTQKTGVKPGSNPNSRLAIKINR